MIADGKIAATQNEWKEVEERARASLKAKIHEEKIKDAAARAFGSISGRKTPAVALAPSFPRPDEKGDTGTFKYKNLSFTAEF